MHNVAAEITRTLDEYQYEWESPDTKFEAELVRRELLSGIEILRLTNGQVEASEFRRLIHHKLAQRNSAPPCDWWWKTPTHPMMEPLLASINLTLYEASRSSAWRRRVSLAWAIVKELLFLGIVAGLLLTARNAFETRVVAILVWIYTYIGLEAGRLGYHLTGCELEIGYVLVRIARRMKIEWDNLEEIDQVNEGRIFFSIRTLSLCTARVFAIVGLVMSFL
jgi:hypothetical protein